jgi:multidrug efflux pump subunit AcrA (membrane-fusion protein)
MGVRVRFLPDNAPEGAETGTPISRIVVPQAAVTSNAEGSFVWVVRDNVAHHTPVEVGEKMGERIEITKGVQAGDQVVVGGFDLLAGESVAVRVAE